MVHQGRAGGEVREVRAPSGYSALGQVHGAQGQMIRMPVLTFIYLTFDIHSTLLTAGYSPSR